MSRKQENGAILKTIYATAQEWQATVAQTSSLASKRIAFVIER